VSEESTLRSEPEFNRAVKQRSRDNHVTSDAGLLLLREADQRLDLTASRVRPLRDNRSENRIRDELLEFVRERLCGLAQGYSTIDDRDVLAQDPALRVPPCQLADADGIR
jgi:hypothetical protein